MVCGGNLPATIHWIVASIERCLIFDLLEPMSGIVDCFDGEVGIARSVPTDEMAVELDRDECLVGVHVLRNSEVPNHLATSLAR